MVQLQLGSGNTTANTNMAELTKRISKNISKPFSNLPQSKLQPQFFSLQPWQHWQPARYSSVAELALATTATPAKAKEYSPN